MIEAAAAALFGLLIGSFLNVCIYRLPRDLSVVRPRSHCVSCQKMISWYDNIPLLSYVLLGGKCRACGAAISLRYPIVELLTAALFFVYVLQLGAGILAGKFCVLGALMAGLIFADLEERILPDEFTLGGLLAGIVFSWFVPVDDVSARALLWLAGVEWGPRVTSLAEAVVGAIVPAAFLWFGGWLFEKLRHKEGLGLGDVKMLAMAGAFLGLRGALLTLILGSVLGSVLGYAYIWLTHKDASTYQLPFGTFLGTGAIAVTLIGQPILGWYGGL